MQTGANDVYEILNGMTVPNMANSGRSFWKQIWKKAFMKIRPLKGLFEDTGLILQPVSRNVRPVLSEKALSEEHRIKARKI